MNLKQKSSQSLLVLFTFLGILLTSCTQRLSLVGSEQENIQIQSTADSISPSTTAALIKPYRQKLLDSLSSTMAIADDNFIKKRPGGSLGNLISDAMHWQAKDLLSRMRLADFNVSAPMFSIMNYGGIRQTEISKGPITLNKIYETLPFENTLVYIECPINIFKKMILGINEESWPVQWDRERMTSLEQIEREYKTILLVTNNYISNGGDQCDFLIPLKKIDSGLLLRDVLVAYLKKEGHVQPSNEIRILK